MSKVGSNISSIDEDGEIAELSDAWFEGAALHENGVLKRRPGERGPGKRTPKQSVTLRLDAEVLQKFRATGPGWQSRINDILAATDI